LDKRNKKILVFAVLVLFVWIFFLCLGARHRPSIILISIDTLRADHLGCYGYPLPTSPSIDLFASDTVLFEYAISQSPTTAPSHMTIFTGLMPKVHGLLDSSVDIHRHKKLCANIPTLAELLRRQGYLTAGFYETGALWPELGFDRGFDIYDDRALFGPGLVAGKPQKLNLIRLLLRFSKMKKQPLFLFLHHYICHDPYLRAPQETIDRFLKEKADGLPTGVKDVVNTAGYDAKRASFWKNANPNNPAHRRHMMALYDASINYSDLLFGEIVKILKEEGFYDDSIVILLSDHGEEFGEHGSWRHGRLLIDDKISP
jgi:arylsulfatase A-like enzyme